MRKALIPPPPFPAGISSGAGAERSGAEQSKAKQSRARGREGQEVLVLAMEKSLIDVKFNKLMKTDS